MNELNSLDSKEARRRLFGCFASRNWAREVADRRPYADLGALLEAAERTWLQLTPVDWMEAISGHPRIGDRGGSSPTASDSEQRSVRMGPAHTLDQLAEGNREYEARFGHVFLIAAAGKSADEILVAMRARMRNDPATEARIAAAEHRKIARLRLEALVRQ